MSNININIQVDCKCGEKKRYLGYYDHAHGGIEVRTVEIKEDCCGNKISQRRILRAESDAMIAQEQQQQGRGEAYWIELRRLVPDL